MNQLFSALKKLGFPRQIYYLIFYPFSYLRNTIRKVDAIHEEVRWIKKANHYLSLLGEDDIPQPGSRFTEEIREYYKPLGAFVNMDDYRIFVHFTGLKSKKFVPHFIFHNHIIPVLNPDDSHSLFHDKNNYGYLFRDFKQPMTVLRYIHGRFYNSDYQPLSPAQAQQTLLEFEENWIVKPSRFSNSGTGVFAGSSQAGSIIVNDTPCTIRDLETRYPHGFIIQEKVRQSDLLAAFHPDSLNTLRVFTLRMGSEIITLPSTYVRFGVNGNHVDNMGSGGVGCGVQSNGDLTKKGIDSRLRPVYKHPDSGEEFQGKNLGFYSDICHFAEEMHRKTTQIDLAAWDIAADEKGEPVFIEVNIRYPNSLNPQLLNGPFFGEYTDDVLDYTIRRKKSR